MSETPGGRVLVVLAAGRARRYGGCKPLAPVGVGGEAVLDLLVSDAVSGGFTRVVLVIGPSTGPAIRYHVQQVWPQTLDVRFAVQTEPLGTVHAVLAATGDLEPNEAFGVCNADDLYGQAGFELLANHLGAGGHDNAAVAYRLTNAVIGDAPVTRGVCHVDDNGFLLSVDERRHVRPDGPQWFVADDGREPAKLSGDTLVSMNLWGFTPHMHTVLQRAMARAGQVSADAEVLLPDVVAHELAATSSAAVPSPGATTPPIAPEGGPTDRLPRFMVLPATGRCVGVTHPGDLALVQAELARQVGAGERPARLWDGAP